jgi:hypothetical protein
MSYDDMKEAKNVILDLRVSLHTRYERDTEAEISEQEIRTIDAALKMAVTHVGDSPIIAEMQELFSPDAVIAGQPIRVEAILTPLDVLSGIINRRESEMASNQPGVTRRRSAH